MKKQLLIGIACLAICLPIFSMNSATDEHEADIKQENEPINELQPGQDAVRAVLDVYMDTIAREKFYSKMVSRLGLFIDRTFGITTYKDFLEKQLTSPELLKAKSQIINELIASPGFQKYIQRIDEVLKQDPQADLFSLLSSLRIALAEKRNVLRSII